MNQQTRNILIHGIFTSHRGGYALVHAQNAVPLLHAFEPQGGQRQTSHSVTKENFRLKT